MQTAQALSGSIGINAVSGILFSVGCLVVALPLLLVSRKIRKSPELCQYSRLCLAFAVFILACGTFPVFEGMRVWQPLTPDLLTWKAACAVFGMTVTVYLCVRGPRLFAELDVLMSNLADAESCRAQADAIGRAQMVIEMGIDGTILKVNANYTRCLGYSAEELEGKPVSILIPSATISAGAYEAFWDAMRKGEPRSGQYERISKSGQHFYVDASYTPILDAHGVPVKVLGLLSDITKRVLIEREREQQEDALREQASLLNLCHDAIIVRDMDGTIRYWNKGAEEIYGYTPREALNRTSHDLLKTIFPMPLAEIEQTFDTRERWEGELKHMTATGAQVVVDSRWALTRDPGSGRLGVMEINSDITERRQAEDALRQSTEKEQLFINGVKDYSIIMLDPQGNITSWNQGAEQIKGYQPEEIIGRHMSVFYPPELIALGRPQLLLEAAKKSGRVEETGWRLRKGGEPFWANVVITAMLDEAGQVRGFCKITRDITEHKLAEEATEKARIAADQASRAKSDFLANMSHEVRTPVNAIMGMAHLALRSNPELRQREYLNKIGTAAKRLLGIMNDILDFSKIEAGKLKLERIPFALSEVMQSLRDVVEQKAREKNLRLTFSVDPGLPAYLSGDPLRLGQILINLVNNAVKFTEHGEVRLTVQRVPARDETISLRFIVADTGIGMTELQMENLFQAFHQADTSFTRQYGGTGLGLAISKQLVEMMGGTITIQSEFGVGTTFTFVVGFGKVDQIPAHPALGDAQARGISKILVVDDSDNTRDELVQLLRHHGQRAYGTNSGEEALTILLAAAQRAEPFHLVVMDWRLPGMNGVEASRRIRHSLELQPTPVILMISAFDRHDIAPTEETGAFDEFLVKPLKEDTFLDAVWSLLGGAQAAPVAADIPPSVNQAALDGRHVLLAEDNDLNRDLATELLTDLGLHVLVAPDGQAAVDIVHAHHVDLILMDIQMPHMDGLTAARIIRSDRRFDGTPIIAMTAHAMTGDRERSLGAGMNDHITKPIDPDLLARTLVRWMPVQRAVAPRVEAAAPAGPVPEQLPPFDIQAALLRTNNKPLLLRKLLLGFRQQYAGAVAELKAFLAEEKWAEAQRLVHSLKSIAATLETKPLAEAAGAIEAALRDGQRTDLDPLIDTFDLALRPAIAAVATLDQGEPAYSTK